MSKPFAPDKPTMVARDILRLCHVSISDDYHTLSNSQVDALLEHAKKQKYRKPKNANGSTGRYFHAKLQREARRTIMSDALRALKVTK